MGALTEEEAKAIEVVAHYTQDEEQAYCMLYGEGVFDTIPIEARPRTMLAHPGRPLAVRWCMPLSSPCGLHACACACACVTPCVCERRVRPRRRRPTTRWAI